MAEREGFEPSVRLHVHTLSRRAPSTARTPLLYMMGILRAIHGAILVSLDTHPAHRRGGRSPGAKQCFALVRLTRSDTFFYYVVDYSLKNQIVI